MTLENVSPDTALPSLPGLLRRREAAKFLGLSPTTMWRLQRDKILQPVQILPGLALYRVETLQKFVAGLPTATPDRARIEKALASPRHGRAGRKAKARKATTARKK